MTSMLPPNAPPLLHHLATAQNTLADVPVPLHTLTNPHTCPASTLPALAWSASVDVFNPAWTEQQQRAVIAAAPCVHKSRGTAASVRDGVGALGLSVSVIEWWQDTPVAPPRTFRVEIDDIGVTTDHIESIDRIVARNKPASAHHTMQVVARPRSTLFIGAAQADFVETTIYPKS